MMAGRLRKLFTDYQVKDALAQSEGDYVKAATILTDHGFGEVSRQMVRYWAKQFDVTKANGDDYLTNVIANRSIREDMSLRTPSLADDGKSTQGCNDRILYFTDMHAPYHHVDMVDFLAEVARRYAPTRIVCGGDEVDNHALSFHDSDPNLDSAGPELEKSKIIMNELHDLFPYLDLVHSNHGSLVYRRALKFGIPVQCIKSYREILFPNGKGQGWNWAEQHRFTLPNGQDIQFQHEASGDLLTQAAHERCNMAIGHLHAKYAINYAASKAALYWALNGGCLVDHKSLAFAYGKNSKMKPILGCTMIIDSLPMLVPMQLNSDGRWIK